MNAATQTVFGMEEIALIESGTERDTAIGHHFTTPLNLLTGRRDWKKPGEVVQRWNIINEHAKTKHVLLVPVAFPVNKFTSSRTTLLVSGLSNMLK